MTTCNTSHQAVDSSASSAKVAGATKCSTTESSHSVKKHSRGRSLSFATKARVLIVPSHAELNQAEKNMLWRTDEDIKATDRDVVTTARAILSKKTNATSAKSSNQDDFCKRGLENIVCGSAVRHSTLRRRRELINAVLDAQEKEWQMGHFHADVNILQAISETYSQKDKDKARTLGASDEAYIRRRRNYL